MLRFTLAALLLAAPPAIAQTLTPPQRAEVVTVLRDALRSDPSILRDAIASLQADDARRQEAASRAAVIAQRAQLVSPADPVAGNPLGDVTLVEFYDTRCPYCRQMAPAMAELLAADPRVKLVYKDVPVLGNASVLESRALLAAQAQGGYGRLQSAIMATTATPTRDSLRGLADGLGLDGARMLRDMDDPAIKDRIEANMKLAQALGVTGTPALVVGDRLVSGAMELGELRQAVADARNAPH